MDHRLETRAHVDALAPAAAVPDRLRYVAEALALLKRELAGQHALLGFGGSPWTLATYMVEGGSSDEFERIKLLFYTDRGTFDALLEKLTSNLHEVRARGGVLYVLADADTRIDSGEGLFVIRMPEHYGELSPLLHVVPLQLLAYHTACARGTDVDKPRNLAKSVTVE